MMIDTNFFQTLYQFCDEGEIELRALPSRNRKFIPLAQFKEIGAFCNGGKENYYFGVALRSGINETIVSKIVRGLREPTEKQKEIFSKLLETPVGELFLRNVGE